MQYFVIFSGYFDGYWNKCANYNIYVSPIYIVAKNKSCFFSNLLQTLLKIIYNKDKNIDIYMHGDERAVSFKMKRIQVKQTMKQRKNY